MGYPTKVQLIQRKASEQWYINFPSAVAQAMEFTRGETVEWIIEDRSRLLLRRLQAPPSSKKKRLDSTTTSASSGKTARRSAASGASSSARKPSP